tara:strand:+ start:308 stop:2113 length:1806 start_codon:yes stop_codon:yes gene_type:complete
MIGLAVLILQKGANIGVKALYVVLAILFAALVLFFLGDTGNSQGAEFTLFDAQLRNSDQFFIVFAIIFPAFTGMTAGVGLSGDLKNPSKSIPLGTTTATISGMIVYFFIAFKLASSASVESLTGNQLVMSDIALFGVVMIPLGLAASTFSSALGSIMVAPRTLQALATDEAFPTENVNSWLKLGRAKDGEPVNASLITAIIAMVFIILGDVDVVAQIISMFFMVTYGSLCLISFLHHFGSSPSYRPSFKSKWYVSLLGFITSVWVMFKISMTYSLVAFSLMTVLYVYLDLIHKDRKGISAIFTNAIFQINRNLQLYLQKRRSARPDNEWRPSAICISSNSFQRNNAFQLLNWISYRYGFGTYLHRINGYYSKQTYEQSNQELEKLIRNVNEDNHVYIDTIISPSYTSAVAQAIQIPGIAGMENNMLIFEYDKEAPDELSDIVENFKLVSSGNFDVCILASSRRPIIYKNGIHIWIRPTDEDNANLMILLSFIILGHPDWKNGTIKIFSVCRNDEQDKVKEQMESLVQSGRLPITRQNIEILMKEETESTKVMINRYSADAALTFIGFREEQLRNEAGAAFEGYEELGNTLFLNSREKKMIF